MKETNNQRRQIRRMIRETLMERKILAEQRVLMLEKLDHVNYELSEKGYSPRMIEEGLMDIFGGGMVSAFKQQAIEYIAASIGVDKDSIVYRFLIHQPGDYAIELLWCFLF